MPKTPLKSKRSLPNSKQAAFLAAYAKTGNITQAAKLAKVDRSDHYGWLKSEAYERKFADAHEEACELLEVEARRRAVEGVKKPVIYQGEICYQKVWNPETKEWHVRNTPLTIREYSDTLLIFLMKGAMPDKYRENIKTEISGELTVVVERLAAARQRLAKDTER